MFRSSQDPRTHGLVGRGSFANGAPFAVRGVIRFDMGGDSGFFRGATVVLDIVLDIPSIQLWWFLRLGHSFCHWTSVLSGRHFDLGQLYHTAVPGPGELGSRLASCGSAGALANHSHVL